jgi:hypothetical protein
MLLGVAAASGDMGGWMSWRSAAGIQDMRGFVIVAYLHSASYLGALLGVFAALIYVRRRIQQANPSPSTPGTSR